MAGSERVTVTSTFSETPSALRRKGKTTLNFTSALRVGRSSLGRPEPSRFPTALPRRYSNSLPWKGVEKSRADSYKRRIALVGMPVSAEQALDGVRA